jgi:PKD repeat protein
MGLRSLFLISFSREAPSHMFRLLPRRSFVATLLFAFSVALLPGNATAEAGDVRADPVADSSRMGDPDANRVLASLPDSVRGDSVRGELAPVASSKEVVFGSDISEQEAIEYVREVWNITDLSDGLLRETLGTDYQGIPFKDYINMLVESPRVLNALADEDYEEAAEEATYIATEFSVSQFIGATGLSGVAAVASAAYWPIDFGLSLLEDAADDKAFRSQMDLYFEARADGNSYGDIVNAGAGLLPHSVIYKRKDGWLYRKSLWANPAPGVQHFTPEEFFKYAEELWDAKQSIGAFRSDRDELREEFREAATGEDNDDDPPPEPEELFARITFQGNGFQAAPSRVTFSAADSYASGEIDDYEWDLGGGQTASGETASRTFYQPGTYEVRLTVTDEDGNTDEAVQEVHVTAPGFTVTPQTLLASRFAGEEDDDVTGYSWDFGDGSTASGRVVEHTYDSYGTYEVELTLSFVGGGSATVEREVYAGPRPVRVGGNIESDQTWSAAYGPYVIEDEVEVYGDPTLTVEAGAVVKFQTDATPGDDSDDRARLRNDGGTLNVEGTAQDSVVFTSLKQHSVQLSDGLA